MKLSLVSYLDPDASSAVRKMQHELSGITGSKASLSSWEPHVTVGDGIELEEGDLALLNASLTSLSAKTSSFKLSLREIGSLDEWEGGAGETPYVIYLDVVLNNELLEIVNEIESITGLYNKWYLMPRPYLPHCTLAFRDLTKEGYESGLKFLENVNTTISTTINHVALVEKLPDIDQELTRFEFID